MPGPAVTSPPACRSRCACWHSHKPSTACPEPHHKQRTLVPLPVVWHVPPIQLLDHLRRGQAPVRRLALRSNCLWQPLARPAPALHVLELARHRHSAHVAPSGVQCDPAQPLRVLELAPAGHPACAGRFGMNRKSQPERCSSLLPSRVRSILHSQPLAVQAAGRQAADQRGRTHRPNTTVGGSSLSSSFVTATCSSVPSGSTSSSSCGREVTTL